MPDSQSIPPIGGIANTLTSKQITMSRFQSIVLKLGNQMFVRHYHWLNYPNDPQLMGLQFTNNPQCKPSRGKTRTCECGDCRTCKHREYMRAYRPKPVDDNVRLFAELSEMGFTRRDDDIWVIERATAVSR
jgi:hypothetical protein